MRGRGRSPLDPESANSNITIRPPRSKRRRTSRLPPSSYVFSWSLYLSSIAFLLYLSSYLPLSLFLSFLTRTLVPKLLLPVPAAPVSLLSFPPLLSLFTPLYACPQCLRCTSALTSTNSRRLARKRRRHKRIFTLRR